MDDCRNAEMKDRLPDLLGDAAARPGLETVRAHVASCESCRSELALLRAVREAHPAPAVDVARVVSALPAYRRPSIWTRASRSTGMRIAAGFVVMVGLAAGVERLQREQVSRDTVAVRAEAVRAEGTRAAGELAVGASLSDLSESDLQELLRDLGDIEAVTSTEEDVVILPALDQGGA